MNKHIIINPRIIASLYFMLITTFSWAQSESDVLILHAAGEEYSWSASLNQEIKKLFNQRGDLAFEMQALSVSSLEEERQITDWQQKMLDSYPTPPSAVMVTSDLVWAACAPLFAKAWKEVPVILCNTYPRMPASVQGFLAKAPLTEENSLSIDEFNKPYNVAVLENPVYLDETVRLIRSLQPEMKTLAFISGDNYLDATLRVELNKLVKACYMDVKLDLLTENQLTTEQLMDTLYAYGPAAGILFHSWNLPDNEGMLSYAERRFGHNLFASAQTPIYTVDDADPVSCGWMGGYYIAAKDFAHSCMTVLDRILAGERASSIKRLGGVNHVLI